MKNRYTSDDSSDGKDLPPKEDFAYEAQRIVGYGSFGVVFEASDLKTKQTVAIKKILREKGHKSREIEIWKH
jgi:serine/threonine protein kinase